MIKFLDDIYLKDEMSEAWIKHNLFQKVDRGKRVKDGRLRKED